MTRLLLQTRSLLLTTLLYFCLSGVTYGRLGVVVRDERDEQEHGDDSGSENDSVNNNNRRRRRLVDEIFTDNSDDDFVKAFVGYKSSTGRNHILSKIKKSAFDVDLAEVNAVGVELPKKLLREFQKDKTIKYIEKDAPVGVFTLPATTDAVNTAPAAHRQHQRNSRERRRRDLRRLQFSKKQVQTLGNSGEKVPYGLKLTKSVNGVPAGTGSTGKCNDPNSFKVGIIDTGIFAGHPDLSCSSPTDPHCKGKSFGTSASWWRDNLSHGKFQS